ncbi:MAG: hypothetical protein WBB62_22460 [Rhodococcus sp. (in: high G+C Gram-positive bacteria)]
MIDQYVDGLPDVGLYVDDERSIAAVSHPTGANPSLHVAALHRTVLYVHADGSASLGDTTDPDAAVFTNFVAEEVESGFGPGALVAMAFRCLLADVARSLGTDPSALAAAATFPSVWTAEQVSSVRIAMNRIGLDHVALVPEAEALAAGRDTVRTASDAAITVARGAARIASEFPVDAVTEEIVIPRPALPVWARTPVLAAAAFAAVLVFGASVTALMLQDRSSPSIPEIDSALIAAPTTTQSPPAPVLPFPTAVPIAEPPAVPDLPETPDLPGNSTPATQPPASELPVSELSTAPVEQAPVQLPPTRPADGASDTPTPPESPSVEESVPQDPTDTGDGSTDESDDAPDGSEGQAERDAIDSEQTVTDENTVR